MELLGGVMISNGNSVQLTKQEWRKKKPTPEEIRDCKEEWQNCPDMAIFKQDEKYIIDYDYCKGCGICTQSIISQIKMEEE